MEAQLAAPAAFFHSSITLPPSDYGLLRLRRFAPIRRAQPLIPQARRGHEQEVGGINSFELPPLHSRFPLRLGPHQESVREECESWGLSLLDTARGSTASPAERQAFLNGRYYLCASLFYPACRSRHRVGLINKFYTFGFMMDDVLEMAGPQETGALLRATIAGWSGAPAPSPSEGGAECSRMGTVMQRFRAEVWEGICSDMSPAMRGRMERLMIQWFHQVGAEQSSARFESIEEYMAFRVVEVGAEVFLPFVEYSLGIEIGEEQLESIPIMVQFRKAVLSHMIWVNDLLSFRKEVIQHAAGGYGRGTIGVLLAQRQQLQAARQGSELVAMAGRRPDQVDGLQQCIDTLWDMIQAEELRIAPLVEEVKRQFPASSDLVKYVDALCHALANNIYWYTISGRYGLVRHAKFLHGQPAGERPTIASLSPHDPTLQFSLKSIA